MAVSLTMVLAIFFKINAGLLATLLMTHLRTILAKILKMKKKGKAEDAVEAM